MACCARAFLRHFCAGQKDWSVVRSRVARAAAVVGWGLAALLLLGNSVAAEQVRPLRLGILPYIGTLNLLKTYQPLRLHLEEKLGRPVQLYTAQNFPSFVRDSQRGDYDLLLTASHFARLAQKDAGYVPLARYANTIHPRLVVAKDDPLLQVSEMRGSSIANADRQALVTIVAVRWLHENGLHPGQYQLQEATSHANAILAAAKGEARGAITPRSVLLQMPKAVQEQLRAIEIPSTLPQMVAVAHPRMPQGTMDLVRTALLSFARESTEGNKFLQSSGHIGFVPVSPAELAQLDPYVKEVRKVLEPRP